MSLSKIQNRYYRCILEFIEKKKYSPSYGEIMQMMGVTSTATVSKIVSTLIARGYLARDPGQSTGRNLSIVPQKMHNMNMCNRDHEPVWYFRTNCPVCELLKRIQDLGA